MNNKKDTGKYQYERYYLSSLTFFKLIVLLYNTYYCITLNLPNCELGLAILVS